MWIASTPSFNLTERIFIGTDANRIGVHRSTGTSAAGHAPIGPLRNREFVIEREGTPGGHDAGNVSELAARKTYVQD